MPKRFKDGELVECSLEEFVQSLQRYSGWAENEFLTRSDPAAHLGMMLFMAANLIAELDMKLNSLWSEFEEKK